jgi:hypothetical protein
MPEQPSPLPIDVPNNVASNQEHKFAAIISEVTGRPNQTHSRTTFPPLPVAASTRPRRRPTREILDVKERLGFGLACDPNIPR